MSILVSIVDSMHGRPAEGVGVNVASQIDGVWQRVVHGLTGADGVFDPLQGERLYKRGVHRLEIDIDGYYTSLGLAPCFPRVTIDFRMSVADRRHHILVAMTPFACTTYHAR